MAGMGTKGRRQDHYEVLGVTREAPDVVVQAAHRARAAKYHPDQNPGDPEAELRGARVNAAGAVLCNKAKRRQYDELTWSPGEAVADADTADAPSVEDVPAKPVRIEACGKCGAKVGSSAQRCANCRADLRQTRGAAPMDAATPLANLEDVEDVEEGATRIRTCAHCGAIVALDATRCAKCWAKLAWEPSARRDKDGNALPKCPRCARGIDWCECGGDAASTTRVGALAGTRVGTSVVTKRRGISGGWTAILVVVALLSVGTCAADAPQVGVGGWALWVVLYLFASKLENMHGEIQDLSQSRDRHSDYDLDDP